MKKLESKTMLITYLTKRKRVHGYSIKIAVTQFNLIFSTIDEKQR